MTALKRYDDLFRLDGKIALVTGSSQGLGLAIAEGLARAGAAVVLNGRRPQKLESARQTLRRKRLDVRASAFDVSNEAEVVEAIERIERDIGPIGILVNNAGATFRAPAESFPTERWREVMATNLDGVFFVSRAVGARMIQRKRGKIINIASLLSEAARPTICAYAASKGAIRMLTRALAVEWAKYNIQVNAIGPGYFETELNRPLMDDEKFDAWVRSRTPAGRWGKPADLVGAAVFFASRASDFVTGQILYVDGGWLSSL